MAINLNNAEFNLVDRENERDQVRELGRRLARLNEAVDIIQRTTTTTTADDIIPGMVNFLDNSDFIFSDEAYNASAYADDEDVLAQWYGRTQATAASYTENTAGAESGESVRRSAHTSGARTGVEWLDSEGTVIMTGGYRLASRLPAKHASAGNYLAARFQCSKRSVSFTFVAADVTIGTEKITENAHGLANGTRVTLTTDGTLPAPLTISTNYYIVNAGANDFELSLTSGGAAVNLTDTGSGGATHTVHPQIAEDIIAKVSIWDNTDNRILRGTKPPLTSQKSGSHTGGTVTRQYILEVVMPDGRTFYSDTSVFTTNQNQVVNSVATTAIDADDFVTVAWSAVVGSSRYRVYRRTPAEADTAWYLVGTITNGSTSVRDFGGTGGGDWAVPAFSNDNKEYQLAEGFFEDIGELLQTADDTNEASFGIQVPSSFTPNGNQFIQIEFLQSDYTNTTTAQIPTDSLRIDRVGLSYTNGRWVPSARDASRNPTPTGTPSPPPTGGGTGTNPPAGGGENTCVREDSYVLMWHPQGKHFWLPANEVVVGDRLVSWDGEELVPTTVYKVVPGLSRSNYTAYALGEELMCSFSHRVIKDINDFKNGTRIGMDLEGVLMYDRETEELIQAQVDSVELINDKWGVITFRLSRGRRNYISSSTKGRYGFFGHNVKPIDGQF